MHIGQVIRDIREARKATLEQVALAADTNASNLSRIERGVQGYSPETLEKIAQALGMTVSDLYLRAETTAATPAATRKKSSSPARLPQATITASKYASLTQENRELVEDFMTLLLKRQQPGKS